MSHSRITKLYYAESKSVCFGRLKEADFSLITKLCLKNLSLYGLFSGYYCFGRVCYFHLFTLKMEVIRSSKTLRITYRIAWHATKITVHIFRGAYCLHHQGALMMEAVRTSETSVNFNWTTQRYIPKDCKLHTCRRENLKSRIILTSL
jgi:hypothetical protein